jgi:hypothetical protein
MVPADSHKASPTSRYSGSYYCCNSFVYGIITLYDVSFQKLQLQITGHVVVLQPRHCLNRDGLGCSLFARHYLGNHFCFLFLQVLRCFSSLGLPHLWVTNLQLVWFSYSEISGSKVICTSPELFAAYHVLHRLQEPRHPPCALNNFLVDI